MKPRVGEVYQQRYLILKELGAGGMGTVYHARQIDVNRDVALKLLHIEKIEEDETVSRFYREFKLLSKLSHPNIMTFYGLALDDESIPFAICEYLDGVSLRSIVNQGFLPWKRALKIAIQICHAMQYAHEHGVLHRDLKPENVIIMQSPEPDSVKLVDFGLSRALEVLSDSRKLTATGIMIGSPAYMSPEQINGKAVSQSDIYALGCLLFELLSGTALFEADAPVAVIYRQLNESPSLRLRSLQARVPDPLMPILAKMLRKELEQRYQSMSEAADELEALLEDPQGKSAALSSFPRAAKPMPIFFLIITGLSALALSGLFLLKYSRSSNHDLARKEATVPISMANSFSQVIARARQLKDKGDFTGAIELYKKALKGSRKEEIDPYKLYDAHSNLASAYEYAGDWAEAAKEWRRAIDIFAFAGSPRRLAAACGLAHILDRLGNAKTADQTYKQYILDCQQSGNVPVGTMVSALNDYVRFLMNQGKLEQAYKWALCDLHYADQIEHGPLSQLVRDRATNEGVNCAWTFFDLSRALGKTAEGRRELDKTMSQLRSTAVRDDFSTRAIIIYASSAEKRGFDQEAEEMYALALKDSSHLSAVDAKTFQDVCHPALAKLKAKKLQRE